MVMAGAGRIPIVTAMSRAAPRSGVTATAAFTKA
jgi:hypothetical protein